MSQWLVLDIGNTHTVAGLYEGSQTSSSSQPSPLAQVRFRTDAHATADEYRTHLELLFARPGTFWKNLQRVIVSTVVPSLESIIQQVCNSNSPALPCLFIKHDTRREFELDLPIPAQLGADRLANVAGALQISKPPFLIVDAGTATTFCLVNARPAYVGGAIAAGFETGWKALQTRAAKLFSVDLKRPEHSIGRTTETQLQSGILLGYEALIEGMTDRLLEDWAKIDKQAGRSFTPPTLFATGGCVQALRLSSRFRIEPDLTLMGLLRYGQLTQ